MKLLWIIYSYPPQLNAGAERYTHNLNKYLISQGHIVCVNVPTECLGYKYTNGNYEGVIISTASNKKERDALVEWSDIVLTHLDYTLTTMEYIRSYRPVVWVSHNSYFDKFDYIKYNENASIIYNSKKMKELGDAQFTNNSIILHPPQGERKQRTISLEEKRKYITLINFTVDKGGVILKEIAERMPNYKFMAVKGGYGKQVEGFPSNVKIVANTTNIQKIYNKSRIILMPSLYESWGMVASEAMENGIPVIASPVFGLEENLAWAGTYASLDDIEQWVTAIESLNDEKLYNIKKNQSLMRAKEQQILEPKELRDCEIFLKKIIQ